jgi:hypothetical protein
MPRDGQESWIVSFKVVTATPHGLKAAVLCRASILHRGAQRRLSEEVAPPGHPGGTLRWGHTGDLHRRQADHVTEEPKANSPV